jgi:protein SCO1/2
MAGAAMNEMPRFASLLLAIALIAGCSAHDRTTNASAAADNGPPLAGATIGGPWTLTDQDGKTVSSADFAGKYRIMYFGYTYCPDVCPTAMQHLGQAMRTLDKQAPAVSAKIVPMFVTVDPARDTPAELKQFVNAFYPRLVGLTGTPTAIRKVADEFRVFYKLDPPGPGGQYLVQHSSNAYLMSPDNKPVALVPVNGPPGPIVATLEQWVK